MLNSSSLSQLKQLKEEIRIANPIIEGTVKGTSKRFGFVVEKGAKKEYLLPQSEMDKVLPGDKVTFKLSKSKSNEEKPVAKLEKLIESNLKTLFGEITESKGHLFIKPMNLGLSRWIFIPPKFRKGLNKNDTVFAKITKHPFYAEGKIHFKITQNIGQKDEPFFEHKFAIAANDISQREWRVDEIEAIRQTAEQTFEKIAKTRKDYSHFSFFTIDGTHTQDLDDAIQIEENTDHWLVRVAIADVSSFIDAGSPLDKIAFKQSSSLYLPGFKSSMLPDILASDICSLKPDKKRLALICEMKIDLLGNLISTQFEEAIINSKAKLSYEDADKIINQELANIDHEISNQVTLLQKLTKTLVQWRLKNAIPVDEFFDYRYQLDDKGKLTSIEKNKRTFAYKMVEETMLTCNMAAANFIAEKASNGLFLSHNGFKEDQKKGVNKFLSTYFQDFDKDSIFELEGYLTFMQNVADSNDTIPSKFILRKKLNRSFWSPSKNPHFGLGLTCYTTFTSPIRKYSDLLTHRIIKSIAFNTKKPQLIDDTIEHLNSMHNALRNTQKQCEFKLKADFIEQFIGKPFNGVIQAINHKQITVFLEEFDVTTVIPIKHLDGKFKFKQDSLMLVSDDTTIQLKENMVIKISEINTTKQFFLAEPA